MLQKTVPVSPVSNSIAANSGKHDSSGEKMVSIATISSQQKSQRWYVIHLNEAVLPRFCERS